MELAPAVTARLVKLAARARLKAHAPYSKFLVGAAVLTEDGEVFVGANMENASYGLSVCAERNAIAAAVTAGHRRLVAVAVVTESSPPATPCGACRQVILEFGDCIVICANLSGEIARFRAEELLPAAFTPADLQS